MKTTRQDYSRAKKQTHNIILAACIREMRYQQGKQHTSGYRHKIVFLPKHIVCGELDQFILISVFAPLPKASPPPVVVINHQIFYPPSAYSLSPLPTNLGYEEKINSRMLRKIFSLIEGGSQGDDKNSPFCTFTWLCCSVIPNNYAWNQAITFLFGMQNVL